MFKLSSLLIFTVSVLFLYQQGGHKRAHYYVGSFETVQEEEEEEEGATLVQREHSDVLDIFDLNLHTTPEEGGGFKVQGLVL